MGILDEAIREHLDLKRRHGAREVELKQLEDEAFGPPSRPGEPDFPRPAASTADETGEVALEDLGAEPAQADDALAAEAPTELVTSLPESPAAEDGASEPPADVGAPGPDTEEELAQGPREDLDAAREPEEPGTAFYDQGDELEAGELSLELDEEDAEWEEEPSGSVREAEAADDVLEETPEFLRDAPEDEELWFEQGEPQDFDFEDDEDEK